MRRPYGGQDGRNGFVARGFRGQQRLGEKVEGSKKADAGRAAEADRMEACLDRKSKTGTREDNRVQRAVQLSLRVADGRRNQYTEGKMDRYRKQSSGWTGFKIRCSH